MNLNTEAPTQFDPERRSAGQELGNQEERFPSKGEQRQKSEVSGEGRSTQQKDTLQAAGAVEESLKQDTITNTSKDTGHQTGETPITSPDSANGNPHKTPIARGLHKDLTRRNEQ